MRLHKKLASGVLALVVLTIGIGYYETVKTERHIRRFMANALELRIGEASDEDVIRLVKNSHTKTYGFASCLSDPNCTGTVYFENTWIYRVHLGPRTAFTFQFAISDHKLRSRRLMMTSSRNTASGLSEWGAFVNEGTTTRIFANEVVPPQEKFFRITGVASSNTLGVMITPEAPADLRSSAYVMNFKCLTKIGGCKTFEEMVPILRRKDLMVRDPWLHVFSAM